VPGRHSLAIQSYLSLPDFETKNPCPRTALPRGKTGKEKGYPVLRDQALSENTIVLNEQGAEPAETASIFNKKNVFPPTSRDS
jgi:hypothetical protein